MDLCFLGVGSKEGDEFWVVELVYDFEFVRWGVDFGFESEGDVDVDVFFVYGVGVVKDEEVVFLGGLGVVWEGGECV